MGLIFLFHESSLICPTRLGYVDVTRACRSWLATHRDVRQEGKTIGIFGSKNTRITDFTAEPEWIRSCIVCVDRDSPDRIVRGRELRVVME